MTKQEADELTRMLDMMRHCTGQSVNSKRNSFTANSSSGAWNDLVAAGLAELTPGYTHVYRLTDSGFRLVYGCVR